MFRGGFERKVANMSLIPMRTLLRSALDGGYALGYFEAWDQYSLEAVIEAAEELRAPVILGVGGSMMNQQWFDRAVCGGWPRCAAPLPTPPTCRSR